MESKLNPSFKKVKAACYSEHKHGFYVYAKPNKCDPKTVVKYIGRYLGRPVIATSRIDKYDGEFVTFHYNRHEDEKYIEETLPAKDFIKRLIRHIPEKHFKSHVQISWKAFLSIIFSVMLSLKGDCLLMKPDIEELRRKYIANPPEGMAKKGSISSKLATVCFVMPAFVWAIFNSRERQRRSFL